MPRFPLYIPSKGRHQYMITSKHLTAMGVRHYIVVEPQEVDAYRSAARGLLADILPLDMGYKERYELCDSLGMTKGTGAGPSRNFIWDHSIASGHAWHWVMDDNICGFFRLNRNLKTPCRSPAFWDAMEDFVLRYQNVAMAGPNYFKFVERKGTPPPFVVNTRIYSCNLIRNSVPFRWRGRYNEDTILSLDMLKAGWCTIQFNAFLQDKLTTQRIGGGNTDELYRGKGKRDGSRYADDGTLEKSKMLVHTHPDVSRLVWKFSRWHHHVDYLRFKRQKLVPLDGVLVPSEPNEYGMRLVKGVADARTG